MTDFSVDEHTSAMLEILKRPTHSSSKSDVLRLSIALMIKTEECISKGGKITFSHADGREEVFEEEF